MTAKTDARTRLVTEVRAQCVCGWHGQWRPFVEYRLVERECPECRRKTTVHMRDRKVAA